jgi:hypothetical protein
MNWIALFYSDYLETGEKLLQSDTPHMQLRC